ncbi:hypothetical protein KFE25_003804 [Diacronema lutheri]|uniref:Multidrug and toxic compound extrusion protein n=1 Tax=Diacronema lutheri TaxID=2081491 RepID=A0A8J5XDE8_DIALT|nr:hypothetical protein KFE25_003804 [Diacronema lutheri]
MVWARSDAARALDERIWHIAVPSLFALALDPLLAAIGTAFVGRLPGEAPLAALSVSASLFQLVFSSFNFFANAATPVIAERVGRHGKAAACDLAVVIVAIAAALGVGALVSLEVAAGGFVALMGIDARADRALHAAARGFIRVRALSAPAVIMQTALNGALRALGDARSGLWAAMGAGCVNLALAVLLIFELGWGVTGAAAATAIAEWCAVAFLAARARAARAAAEANRDAEAAALRGGSDRLLDAEGRPRSGAQAAVARPLAHALAPFFRGSMATILRTVALQLFFAGATLSLGGERTALASHQLLLTVYAVVSFGTDALAIAAQQMVASAQRVEDKRAAAARVLHWGALVGLACGAALAACAQPLVGAMARSRDVRAATVPVLRRLSAPLQPLSALVFAADGVLQGSLDFGFEAFAMGVAAAAGGALLLLEAERSPGVIDVSRAHDAPIGTPSDAPAAPHALWAAWRAIAIVQLARFAAFTWRYWGAHGPLRLPA